MSRFWTVLSVFAFVHMLLDRGLWHYLDAACLLIFLAHLWLTCRSESQARHTVVLKDHREHSSW